MNKEIILARLKKQEELLKTAYRLLLAGQVPDKHYQLLLDWITEYESLTPLHEK